MRAARDSGMALPMVLGISAVLATLALGLTASQNAGAAFEIRTEDRIAAAHVADGLVERGVLALIDQEQRARLPRDGLPVESNFLDHTARLIVEDEWGKIDLNVSLLPLIEAAMRNAGIQDPGSIAGLVAAARQADQKLESLNTLAAIADMTSADRAALNRFFTVHSRSVLVDPWVAGPEVLAALTGADPASIAAFVLARSRIHQPTPPDLFDARYLGQSPARIFTVRAEVLLDGGHLMTRRAVIDLGRGAAPDPRILEWQ